MHTQRTLAIVAGSWIVNKLRRQQREVGTYQAARNAKKQGVPIEVAVAALAGRVEPTAAAIVSRYVY